MQSPQSISNLIGEIYDGVVDASRWHHAIRRFVDISGGRFAFFAVIDSATATLPASSLVGPETSRLAAGLELHRELVPLDPGVPYALARPDGGVFRFSDTSRALTQEPETWRDFICHELGSGDYHSRFGAQQDGVSLVLALHTTVESGLITPEQEQLHALVFDHFQRAVRLACRPPNLARTRHAMVLVSADGTVLDASPAAEAILSENDGLKVEQGRVRAADQRADQQMRRLIQSVCRGGWGRRAERFCRVRRPSDERDYLLRLGAVPLADLGLDPIAYRCLIEIAGARTETQAMGEELQALFGLTPREAEIAILFVSGHNDLRSIALHLAISHETARVHARSIFSKLGVANQVELVRILTQLQ